MPTPVSAAAQSVTSLPPIATMSHLDFDQIFDLLNPGLASFIAVFAKSEKLGEAFKLDFSSSLKPGPQTKKNFAQFSSLLIKASYPGIFKLSPEDKDNLQKLGFMPQAKNLDNPIKQFFLYQKVMAFIQSDIKKDHREKVKNLVDTIYGSLEAIICSIELEKILIKHDKHNKPITQEKQDPIFSSIDLQLTNATNNLKTYSAILIADNKDIKKVSALTQALEKIRTGLTTALNEYKSKLAARDRQTIIEKAAVTQSELKEAKHTIKTMEMQLAEEKRRAEELEAEKIALAKVAAEKPDPEKLPPPEYTVSHVPTIKSVQADTSIPANTIPDNNIPLKSVPAHDLPPPIQQVKALRKEIDYLRTERDAATIIAEAKETKASEETCITTFENLVSLLKSPDKTPQTLLQGIIDWEKMTLAYLDAKIAAVTAPPAVTYSLLATMSFIGRKTGMVKSKKEASPLEQALDVELKEIIKLCLMLTANVEQRDFMEIVQAFNQQQRNLITNHQNEADTLNSNAIYLQLSHLTAMVTGIATERFGYKTKQQIELATPASQPPSP